VSRSPTSYNAKDLRRSVFYQLQHGHPRRRVSTSHNTKSLRGGILYRLQYHSARRSFFYQLQYQESTRVVIPPVTIPRIGFLPVTIPGVCVGVFLPVTIPGIRADVFLPVAIAADLPRRISASRHNATDEHRSCLDQLLCISTTKHRRSNTMNGPHCFVGAGVVCDALSPSRLRAFVRQPVDEIQ